MRLEMTRESASSPCQVPAHAHVLRIQVRSYEATRDGRITPATVLRYLEYLATQASAARGFDHEWYERRGSAWVVRDMALKLGALPGIDDELRMATWLSEFRRVQAYREYALWHERTGRLIARARARWAYIDRARGVPIRIHDDLLEGFGILGNPMRECPLPPQPATTTADLVRATELTAREYEADTQQHINNCVYVDWLSEATNQMLREPSAAQRGSLSRWRPRWYQIEYARPTLPGNHVSITTHAQRVASRRMDVWQVIRTSEAGEGGISVRSYSQHLLALSGRE